MPSLLTFLVNLHSLFAEKDKGAILPVICTFIILFVIIMSMITEKSEQRIIKYNTEDNYTISINLEGYDFGELPISAKSKNCTISEDEMKSYSGKSLIESRTYGYWKYLYLDAKDKDLKNIKVFADDVNIEGEIVSGTGALFQSPRTLYRFDIANCEYVKIKYSGKGDLIIRNLKLYNSYDIK